MKILLEVNDGVSINTIKVYEDIQLNRTSSLDGCTAWVENRKWLYEDTSEEFDSVFYGKLDNAVIGEKFGYRDLIYKIVDIED